jgi:hypothetical protein
MSLNRLTRLPAPVLFGALVIGLAWCLLTLGAIQAARQDPVLVLYIDFDFIPAYILLLGSLALLAGRVSPPEARISAGLLLWLILAGALVDVIENAAMLAYLGGHAPAWAPWFASLVATVKLALPLFAFFASVFKLGRSAWVSARARSSPAPGS